MATPPVVHPRSSRNICLVYGRCFGLYAERPCQLIADVFEPMPCKPGQPARHDYLYERNGVCNTFLMFSPHAAWQHIKVTERRTKQNFAECTEGGRAEISIEQFTSNSPLTQFLREISYPQNAKLSRLAEQT
jgi:hypothetical protein